MTSCNNVEDIMIWTLVNEGKHIRVLNAKRSEYSFNEKELRDSAYAEVSRLLNTEETSKDIKVYEEVENEEEELARKRDRNKEHARNTRLRKKSYASKLKELVDNMTNQKIIEDFERADGEIRLINTRIAQRSLVRTFLYNYSYNITDYDNWLQLLDEDCTFKQPIMSCRHKKSLISSGQHIVTGIDEVIADSTSLVNLIKNIGTEKNQNKKISCTPQYLVSTEDMLVAGGMLMCQYILKIEGLDNIGMKKEVLTSGMIQCRFNGISGKINYFEFCYDVSGFCRQLHDIGYVITI